MARKSRKAAIIAALNGETEQVILPERIYNTAIYVRLSVEDNNYGEDSDSIEIQQLMLERFVNEQADMRLYSVFSDNGHTGTDFDRPAFEKMMDEAVAGKIDCIVVKDLSRFGRNYVEAGYYLEKTFPTMGLRFVALHDGYDSFTDDGSNSMIVSLKNLINDFYAKDISRKINTSLEIKQNNGEFIGAFAPYGYQKSSDDKHRLVIDENTAPTVHQIFMWKAGGVGNTTIARRLNEASILCPAMYHYALGHYSKKKPVGTGTIWQGQMIKLLTSNPVYAGHMAQGKTKKALCDGLPTTVIPCSDWIVVQNTHEAIVDEETFTAIQQRKAQIHEAILANKGKFDHLGIKDNIFMGILYCGDCKTKMVRYKDTTKTSVRYYQQCRVYNENLSLGCVKKSTREEVLEQSILAVLQTQMKLALDMKKLLNKFNRSAPFKKEVGQTEKQIAAFGQKIKRITTLKNALFESLDKGLISETDFTFLKEKYNAESAGLKEEQQKSELLLQKFTDTLTAKNRWVAAFEKYAGVTVLTREILLELVSRVWVWADNRFEVVLNFRDEFEVILDNVEGAKELCQKHSLSI